MAHGTGSRNSSQVPTPHVSTPRSPLAHPVPSDSPGQAFLQAHSPSNAAIAAAGTCPFGFGGPSTVAKRSTDRARSQALAPPTSVPTGAAAAGCPFRGAGATAAPAGVTAAPAVRKLNASDVRGFEEIPGPGDADVDAYNGRTHHYVVNLHNTYGDIIALRITSLARAGHAGPRKTAVFVRGTAEVKDVLLSEEFGKTWDAGAQSTATVDYVHNLIQPMLTNTVFNQQSKGGDTVAGIPAGRAAMRATFLAADAFEPLFAAAADRELEQWAREAEGGGALDVLQAAHRLLRSTLLVAIAGSAAERCGEASGAAFHEAMEYFVRRYSSARHLADVSAGDERQMAALREAGLRAVRAWRAHVDSLDPARREHPSEARSMLAMMSGRGYTDDDMAAMLVNTVIAGAEAPASALAQTLEELAYNPGVQRRVAAEVRGRAEGAAGPVAQLEYTGRCVLEGLRRFAPATLVQRVALQDTVLAGYRVPAGTVVGVCMTAVHMDPKVFAAPEAFDPLRARLDVAMLQDSHCFLPFSGGPRGCPGKHLGVRMLQVSLAKVVERFELAPAQPNAPRPSLHGAGSIPKFVEWQIEGIPLAVSPRTNPAVKPTPLEQSDVVMALVTDEAAEIQLSAKAPVQASRAMHRIRSIRAKTNGGHINIDIPPQMEVILLKSKL